MLLEQDDLASKTSSSSTKLIHGGLRYLENYEFREAPLAEQNETLMEVTEVMLREQLRDLVKSDSVETDVQTLTDKINSNLDQADKLLTNHTETN